MQCIRNRRNEGGREGGREGYGGREGGGKGRREAIRERRVSRERIGLWRVKGELTRETAREIRQREAGKSSEA